MTVGRSCCIVTLKRPRIYSVMGAKIDNIYDLFEALPQIRQLLARCARRTCFSDERQSRLSLPANGRYGAVIVLGFGVDFGITLALSRLVGLPLELSAAIGFIGALALNYVLFEFWVFRRENSTFSAPRLLQTALAAGAALSVRVVSFGLSGKILGNSLPEVVATILLAAGASVLVNYLLLLFIFGYPCNGFRALRGFLLTRQKDRGG